MDTTVGTLLFFLDESVVLAGLEPNLARTTDSHPKRIKYQLLYPYVIPPDDGL